MKIKYITLCCLTAYCLLFTVCLFSEDDIDDIIDGLDSKLKPVPVEEHIDPVDALNKVADLMESAQDRLSSASNWTPGSVSTTATATAEKRQQQALDELDKLFKQIVKLQSDASTGLKKVLDSAKIMEPKGSGSSRKKTKLQPKPRPKPESKDTKQSDQGPAPRAYDAKGDLPPPYTPRKSDGKKWGNLPPKLREEIIQSAQEEFLPEYQDRLSRYYKILAGQE